MFFLRLAEGGEDEGDLGGSEGALVGGIAGGGEVVEERGVRRHPVAEAAPGMAGRRVWGIEDGQFCSAERSEIVHVAMMI